MSVARLRVVGLASLAVAVLLAGAAPAARSATARRAARPAPAAKAETAPPAPTAKPARGDSAMALKGGQEGTVFGTLTVQGEDRVHLDFARPELALDLDPASAPGLELGNAHDVLDRSSPDLTAPLVGSTAAERSPYLSRPWLQTFAAGSVARFQPEVKNVERWKLTVADSRGDVVATYQGTGDPPREIAWDGRTKDGGQAAPGLTYSYVFEAMDHAGNKRNFVGQGFEVPAYRADTPLGPVLVFPGRELARQGGAEVAPLLLEAASWINRDAAPTQTLRVTATARRGDEATALAAAVADRLATLTLGERARIQRVARVQPDAPEGGTVTIEPLK